MSQHTKADDVRKTEILIVEDQRRLVEAFAGWLGRTHSVQTAYTGEGALDAVDEGVDIVLLDRRLPDMPGNAVLEEFQRRGLDPQVAMVSAVEPDEEILGFDIDEYVRKPVTCAEMAEIVETLADRQRLDPELRTYLAELSKKRALEAEQPVSWLASSRRYQRLVETLAAKREELPELPAQEETLLAKPESRKSAQRLVG